MFKKTIEYVIIPNETRRLKSQSQNETNSFVKDILLNNIFVLFIIIFWKNQK